MESVMQGGGSANSLVWFCLNCDNWWAAGATHGALHIDVGNESSTDLCETFSRYMYTNGGVEFWNCVWQI